MGNPFGGSITLSSDVAEREQLRNVLSREEKISDGMTLLAERCRTLEVEIVQMQDDGNCQFRAVAHELFGHQRHHAAVRARVVAHLENHAANYSAFVDDEDD